MKYKYKVTACTGDQLTIIQSSIRLSAGVTRTHARHVARKEQLVEKIH